MRRMVSLPKFQNVEYRTYVFVQDSSKGGIDLREVGKEKPLEQDGEPTATSAMPVTIPQDVR
jgi:hypothetical protein